MTLAYYTHPDCRAHVMGRGHPECPERLDAIHDYLIASGLIDALDPRDPPLASDAQLERAHAAAHVEELRAAIASLHGSGEHLQLDPDTSAAPGSWNAMLRAAGAAVAATDAVIDRSAETAFCAVRPPGHHATRGQAMGFCFFNNVCVAARHALDVRGLARVAIIDFDVHHGNGTEDIVAGDERILMASFFQHPLYPYSGAVPKGTNMVNVPVPPYARGPQVRAAIEQMWLPRLDEFRPQMIFISAGFDAHREDELGQLGLVEDDYAWITRQLVAVAARHAEGRIVSCLEGGYNLGALARSVATHLRVLAGLA
jgi:acetoin utilization deacetylase AcuC-like enzyme